MIREQSISYNGDILSSIFSFITSVINKVNGDWSQAEEFLFLFLANQNQSISSLAQQTLFIIFNKYQDRISDPRY